MKLLQAFMFIGFLKYITPIHDIEFQQGYTVDEKPVSKLLVVNASMNLRNIIRLSLKDQEPRLQGSYKVPEIIWGQYFAFLQEI